MVKLGESVNCLAAGLMVIRRRIVTNQIMIKGLGIFILGRLGFDSVSVAASLRVSSRSSSLDSGTLAPASELTKDVLMLFHLNGHTKLVSPLLRVVKTAGT